MLLAIKVLNAKKSGNQDIFIGVKKAHFHRVASLFSNGLFEGQSFGFEKDMFVSNLPMTDVVISNDPTRPNQPHHKSLQITFQCADEKLSNNTFQIDAKVFDVAGEFVDLSREAVMPLQDLMLLDLNNDLEVYGVARGINFPFKKLFHSEDSIGYKHEDYGLAIVPPKPELELLDRTERKNVLGTTTLRDAGVLRINSTLRSTYLCECCGYTKTLTAPHFGVIQASCPICDLDGYIDGFTTKTAANALQRTFVPVDLARMIVNSPVKVREFFKFQALSDYISSAKAITLDYGLERQTKTFV